MRIKIYNDELVEFPDELAALVLINPVFDQDVPHYSLEEVNAVVHGVLGTYFEEGFTLEQNIAEVRDIYTSQRTPSAANLAKALALIRHYNQNIALEDITRVRADLVFPCGGNNYKPKSGEGMDQVPKPDSMEKDMIEFH
jgi:hypothetical protein